MESHARRRFHRSEIEEIVDQIGSGLPVSISVKKKIARLGADDLSPQARPASRGAIGDRAPAERAGPLSGLAHPHAGSSLPG
jgi:hypothetical protein